MRHRLTIPMVMLLLLVGQACESKEFMSAKSLVQDGDLEQAEEYFLLALEAEPENAEIPFLLARDVYAPQERWREMTDALDEALRRNPQQEIKGGTVEAWDMLFRQEMWTEVYRKGALLYNSILEETGGETADEEQAAGLRQVVEYFLTAIEILPGESATYRPLVFTYRQLGDKEGEAKTIATALELNPENGVMLMLAGENAFKDKRPYESLQYLERASKVMPDNLELLQFLTSVYLDLDSTEGALVTLERARASSPRSADVFFNIGAIYTNVANEALSHGQDLYRDAVKQTPLPEDKIKKALQYFKDAQVAYSEGLYFMDNVLALTPDDAAADQAIREIRDRKRLLDALQMAVEGLLD